MAPRYNIAPSQKILVVGRSAEGHQVVRPATWGFRPKWLDAKRRTPINARAETAATTPMFRSAFRKGRCIIPADGYYEWTAPDSGTKQPYFFHRPDDDVFWLAGLASTDAEGNRTCAILTVDANEIAAAVHSRMQLILPSDGGASAWLEPEATVDDLMDLLKVPAEGTVSAYPVSRRVNRPNNDDPRCVEPVEAP